MTFTALTPEQEIGKKALFENYFPIPDSFKDPKFAWIVNLWREQEWDRQNKGGNLVWRSNFKDGRKDHFQCIDVSF
jgi:hypothetical protein